MKFRSFNKLFTVFCILIALPSFSQKYSLDDYLRDNPALTKKVDSLFYKLNSSERIAQLLMPAAGRLGQNHDTIRNYIKDGLIGGILMLNGTKDQFKSWIKEFNTINSSSSGLPFLYSADAEPSLVNQKIKETRQVSRANEINSLEEVAATAKSISEDLNEIGINYNFAPVVDMASNKTVGYRGFGSNPENIVPYSNEFIRVTQEHNIIATAKHFPGHGLVSGDTHKSLQVIKGEMKELKTYPPLIEDGVLSIMVAHIAVQDNARYRTNGLPATTSKRIVTYLLRDSLNFEGLIVTDAMGMGGVSRVEDSEIKAIAAGCDILLMPKDTRSAHKKLLNYYNEEASFKETVDASVKRIIRMKICLGLI